MKRAKIILKDGKKVYAVWCNHAMQWRQDIDAVLWIPNENIKAIMTLA